MKKYIAAIVLALFVLPSVVSAQAPNAFKLELDDTSPAAYPSTTIKVKMVVQKEVVKTGPYARFAQKYIGTMAPLSDKVSYTVMSASVDYSDPERNSGSTACVEKTDCQFNHVNNPYEFTGASPDRMSLVDKSAEEMARDAANMIYTLRRRRFDLISGEAGENVFGEGLKAAIDEMSRIENEYLSLFLGKRSVSTVVEEYDVVPVDGTSNYVVCRFSPVDGLLPDTDLSADPIVLALTPDNAVGRTPAKMDKRYPNVYRVADWADCRVMWGTQTVGWGRVPVYQFGVTVTGR